MFAFSAIVCFGAEQIELSSRLGKSISLDTRNYFGLFPDVKDYKSAVLIKNAGYNYFEITAGKLNEKSKIILTDSAVTTLAYVIDNYEGIISEPAQYKLNGKLISGLIRVSTQFNKKAKSVNITLRDSTKFSGFILYADSSNLVTTPDRAYRATSSDFRITPYSDIYSISNVAYPIIDGTEIVFLLNLKSYQKNALFKSVNGIKVVPPEVLKFVDQQQTRDMSKSYESPLDFDNLYFKRMSISLDYSYEQFYPDKLQLLSIIDMTNVPLKLTLDRYYSYGFNFDYKLTKFLKLQLGYSFEKIDFNISQYYQTKSILGNNVNFDLYLKVWSSKKKGFEPQRIYAYLYGGIKVNWYNYNVNTILRNFENPLVDLGIDSEMKKSYHAGINFNYKFNNTNFLSLSGFVNYHKNLGMLFYSNTPEGNCITRYIDYIYSYGFTIGYGAEF